AVLAVQLHEQRALEHLVPLGLLRVDVRLGREAARPPVHLVLEQLAVGVLGSAQEDDPHPERSEVERVSRLDGRAAILRLSKRSSLAPDVQVNERRRSAAGSRAAEAGTASGAYSGRLTTVSASELRERRARLAERLAPGSLALVRGAPAPT